MLWGWMTGKREVSWRKQALTLIDHGSMSEIEILRQLPFALVWLQGLREAYQILRLHVNQTSTWTLNVGYEKER